MTCHIVVMRHTESYVASIGHFDNFSCWQFGDESSAHKEGLRVMMEEIEFLSKGDISRCQGAISRCQCLGAIQMNVGRQQRTQWPYSAPCRSQTD